MPVLPLIDALILTGWSSLMVAAVLKAITMSTTYNPSIAGLSARDFLLFAGICMLFSLTLAARTWVKGNEPRMLRERARREFEPFAGEGPPNGNSHSESARRHAESHSQALAGR